MDVKYEKELAKTIERVRYDVEDGIIAHLMAKRQQVLQEHVADVCYTKNDFTYLQA